MTVKRVLGGVGVAVGAIGLALLAPTIWTSAATVPSAPPSISVVEAGSPTDVGGDSGVPAPPDPGVGPRTVTDALRDVATPTADELGLCRFRADLFELDPSAGSSPDLTMRALATRLLAANPDTIAAVYVESPYETAGQPPRIRVTPAAEGFDLVTAAEAVIAGLPPEFQAAVSMDDLYATAPAGYSFAQLCAVYIDAANAGDATIGTPGAVPAWVSLALISADATVEIGVNSSVSDFATTLKDRYGDVVRLVQEREEGPQLWALRSDGE